MTPQELRSVVVCGGRDYAGSVEHVQEVLTQHGVTARSVVIHGDARGADRIAGEAAENLGAYIVRMPAQWDKLGKAAGPARNRQMLDLLPDLVIAFPGGRGTADMVGEARRRNIPVVEVTS